MDSLYKTISISYPQHILKFPDSKTATRLSLFLISNPPIIHSSLLECYLYDKIITCVKRNDYNYRSVQHVEQF